MQTIKYYNLHTAGVFIKLQIMYFPNFDFDILFHEIIVTFVISTLSCGMLGGTL